MVGVEAAYDPQTMRRAVVALGIAVALAACRRSSSPPPRSESVVTVEAAPSASIAVSAVADAAPPPVVIRDEREETKTIAVPGGPAVTVRTLGSAYLEVSVSRSDKSRWSELELERWPDGADTDAGAEVVQRGALTRAKKLHAGEDSVLHATKPGGAFVYRARTKGGVWSEPIVIHSPDPSAPPAAPTGFHVRAESSFAARLDWTAPAAKVPSLAGFAIEGRKVGQKEFVRVALVNPSTTAWTHHHLLPRNQVEYRVRAFNARGGSPPTEAVAIELPEKLDAPGTKKSARGGCAPAPPPGANPNGPCMPLDTVTTLASGAPLLNAPGTANPCDRHLFAPYGGCNRLLGHFMLQAEMSPVEGYADEGFPLLHAIAGAGQFVGANILTLRFEKGVYYEADNAFVCGENPPWTEMPTLGYRDAELGSSVPPFEECADHLFE